MNFAMTFSNELFSRHVGRADHYYLFDDAGTNIFFANVDIYSTAYTGSMAEGI